jgi:integrase
MARTIGRLKAIAVAKVTKPGMYGDGGGLFLQVTSPTAKSWVFRYTRHGRERYAGLGSAFTISLQRAREDARQFRELLHDGIDPLEHRNAKRLRNRLEAAKSVTFDECVEAYVAAHEAGWSNSKHRQQWRTTLRDYASPVLGGLAVQAIDTGLVMQALEPIWATKAVTARRLRGRIETVLDWATVRGFRSGDNPARWRGHLKVLLPARSKERAVNHHAALAYSDIGRFMAALSEQKGVAARALEFCILTASRSGEVLGVTWDEIDAASATWTVPAQRMKGGREHRVPLCAWALAIVEKLRDLGTDYVFPGARERHPLSKTALPEVLERKALRHIGGGNITVHGMRSAFRDWAAETTSFPNHVVEMALAHAIPSAVEASYRRGDLFAKRRKLMEAWAAYCSAPGRAGDVVQLRGGR